MATQGLLDLAKWQPVRIDALGLVTLLGANELDHALGKLTQSRLCEYLPLLAPFIISTNGITKPVPGATLYNITDGIVATDVSGWFVRWLMGQTPGWNKTTLIITYNDRPRERCFSLVPALLMCLLTMGPILALAIIQIDGWGIANASALLVSIICRNIVLVQNRRAIDAAAEEGHVAFNTGHDMVKVFLTLPGGKFLTIHCPRGILVNCLLTTPRPQSPRVYAATLAASWISTGVHIVAIGMASLADQIVCVSVIILCTILVVKGLGYREGSIGTRLSFGLFDAADDSRSAAYARAHLTQMEEETALAWHLLPRRTNTDWWKRYRDRPEHKKQACVIWPSEK